MSIYKAPVEDMMFALGGVDGLAEDDLRMVLDSAGQLASGVLLPLSVPGDRQGSRLENGVVRTPEGFKDAYRQYCAGGWNGVPFNPDHGGQGLPWAASFAIMEMWQSANAGFALCPMLNLAAVEAIEVHGTKEQQDTYLDKLVSGEWTGTMNLTEPQAGTDLGLIKTKAEKQSDGTYKIRGQKIFITYGEHDFTGNIVHLVLARIDGAPEGTKGISMFIVPKFLPDKDGKPGKRNDLKCVSLEHKLGIHASPTCVMQFGDNEGAAGLLIGRENEGLKNMFTMMNNARLSVGLQGVAVAERARQHAVKYASERVQGSRLSDKSGARVAIAEHPDVRRMILSMDALVEAGRALTYEAAKNLDKARAGDKAAQARVDLLTPVVKAWCTDMALEVTSTALQVHGGMGFIEETGIAQHYRDARIMPIYEGTNGIQAMDLAFRKTALDKGAAMDSWCGEAEAVAEDLARHQALTGFGAKLKEGIAGLRRAAQWVQGHAGSEADAVASVAVPYLQAFGTVAGGVMMAQAALTAQDSLQKPGADAGFCRAKIVTALFYAAHILPRWRGNVETVLEGANAVAAAATGP